MPRTERNAFAESVLRVRTAGTTPELSAKQAERGLPVTEGHERRSLHRKQGGTMEYVICFTPELSGVEHFFSFSPKNKEEMK